MDLEEEIKEEPGTANTSLGNSVFVSEMTPLKQESKGEFSEPGPTQEEPFEGNFVFVSEMTPLKQESKGEFLEPGPTQEEPFEESDYLTDRGEFGVDAEGTPTLLNSLMNKLSYYRFGELRLDYRSPAGFDRTRNAIIGNKNFELTYLEEAYTTEHWLVRIYKVKKPNEFNRPRMPVSERKIKRSKIFISKKTNERKEGSIKNKPLVVKGKKPNSSPTS